MADSPRPNEEFGRSGNPGDTAERLVEGLDSHAIFLLDEGGEIVAWPAPAVSLYGHEARDALDEHVRVLFADDREESTIDELTAALEEAGTGVIEVEGWHERADGSVFWGSLSVSPLSEGRDGFTAVCRDTTVTKEYEQMLERQNDRLKEFTDILAHDLRNPLNAIEQHLTLYKNTREETHLESIHGTVDRMTRLVEDLLRVARQGDVIAEPEPSDIEEIIHTAWEGTGSASATLQYESVPTVSTDPDRLCELFENLFRNAIEHGGRDDRTESEDSTDTTGQVLVRVGPLDGGFYVEDDGPGVPDHIGEEVFDHGVTTARGGSGYGLSIVRTIVNAHGWDIALGESSVGGARFEVTGIEFLD